MPPIFTGPLIVYTKTGRKEYVETDQEFKQVIKEDAIEKDIED